MMHVVMCTQPIWSLVLVYSVVLLLNTRSGPQ